MFLITKRIEISGSHSLSLPYPSKCSNLHGHNWIVTIHCKAPEVNAYGMVTDFNHIKEQLHSKLDHKNLNEVLPFNPTAENIARWICDSVENCYRVDVEESAGNTATYIKD